ncbi:hypothetical protein D3C76_1004060 [compost metagenome]
MHQAGIVGHHRIGAGHQVDGFGQGGFAGEVHRLLAQTRDQAPADIFAAGVIVLRTEDPHLPAVANLRLGDLRVVLRRPALGLAEFGTGTQRQHRTVERQAELGQRGGAAMRIDAQTRLRIGLDQLGARLVGQRHEALDHQRVALFVELADVVEQAVAHLALPAGALGNPREIRHQCRFQRVGQEDRLVVLARQRLADAPPRGDVQHAVAEREAQGLADFRHAFEDRPAPFGRQHVDFTTRMALLQAMEQRLRHHHVADPGGTYDENIHMGCRL